MVSNLPAQHIGWRIPVTIFRPVKCIISGKAPQISQVGGPGGGGAPGAPGGGGGAWGVVVGTDGGGGDGGGVGKSLTQHDATDSNLYCPALVLTSHSASEAEKLYSLSRAAAHVNKVPSV